MTAWYNFWGVVGSLLMQWNVSFKTRSLGSWVGHEIVFVDRACGVGAQRYNFIYWRWCSLKLSSNTTPLIFPCSCKLKTTIFMVTFPGSWITLRRIFSLHSGSKIRNFRDDLALPSMKFLSRRNVSNVPHLDKHTTFLTTRKATSHWFDSLLPVITCGKQGVVLTLKEEAEALDILALEVSDSIESCLRKLFSLPYPDSACWKYPNAQMKCLESKQNGEAQARQHGPYFSTTNSVSLKKFSTEQGGPRRRKTRQSYTHTWHIPSKKFFCVLVKIFDFFSDIRNQWKHNKTGAPIEGIKTRSWHLLFLKKYTQQTVLTQLKCFCTFRIAAESLKFAQR